MNVALPVMEPLIVTVVASELSHVALPETSSDALSSAVGADRIFGQSSESMVALGRVRGVVGPAVGIGVDVALGVAGTARNLNTVRKLIELSQA